jgi:ribosomal-protein-alanine N-acetyltransferase
VKCFPAEEDIAMAADWIVRRLTAEERDAVWSFARQRALGGWCREEFERFQVRGLHGGLLAQRGHRLAGFILHVLDVEKAVVTLVAAFVAPRQRRRGIGSALLAELARRLQAVGQTRLEALVSERDLPAQLFLRANGFRAVRVLPAAFAGGADDGYCFERPSPAPAGGAALPRKPCRRRS